MNIEASCHFVKDVLRGDEMTEMQLSFLTAEPEAYPFKDDE